MLFTFWRISILSQLLLNAYEGGSHRGPERLNILIKDLQLDDDRDKTIKGKWFKKKKINYKLCLWRIGDALKMNIIKSQECRPLI